MKANKVIGIISYLPENIDIRRERFIKLKKLILKCNELFKLPVIIIAQAYRDSELNELNNLYNNLNIYSFKDKLGITGARKELRSTFLSSNFDYLIMFDDDIELIGTSGKEYLKQIDDNPNCFIENNKSRLQLFAISKTIFNKQDFIDVKPEDGEAFEDRIFFYNLCKNFPEAHKKFNNTGIEEKARATKDILSTWYHGQDLIKMIQNTEKLLK